VRRTVDTTGNADVLGPYSHAATDGKILCTAGQIPITPGGTVLADEPIEVQTEQSLSNIERTLAEVDLTMDHVLKTTVYMTDIDEFDGMNEAYTSFFESDPPARTALEVQRIADEAAIEIEAVATHR
jgi:reactive intermediate/imine deaminase